MTAAPGRLRLGTRASRLARAQTGLVRDALERRRPGLACEEVVVVTEGDRDAATPLPEIGGRGVFTAALERALHARDIDVAVHSLKDLPTEQDAGLALAAVGFREDARDVLVAPRPWTLDTLPEGATVGTCSLRRTAQLLARRPDLVIRPLRGNVDTRIRRVLAGEYDAVVLAAAGLHRLGLASRITQYLPLDAVLPAPGQGALAIQCRAEDGAVREEVAALDDGAARAATEAERAFLEGLGGGCTAPVAAYGRLEGGELILSGLVASPDGTRVIRLEERGPSRDGRALGLALAAAALAQGAEALLR